MTRLALPVATCSVLLWASHAMAQTPPPQATAPTADPPAAPPPAPIPTVASPAPVIPPAGPAPIPPSQATPDTTAPYYPSPYGYPTPYGQPGWAMTGELPDELPYTGGPIPLGFRVEEKYSLGLLISGPTLFGLAYMASAWAAADSPNDPTDSTPWKTLFIPITGPFAFAYETNRGDGFIYIFEGLAQLAGVGLFLGGVLNPKQRLVKHSYIAYEPTLYVGPQGMTLKMNF